jgi:hypothetical protein
MIGYHVQLMNGKFEKLEEIEEQQEPCGTVESIVIAGFTSLSACGGSSPRVLISCFLVQSMGWSCDCGGAKITQTASRPMRTWKMMFCI